MIYFTEITQAAGKNAEVIQFQFYPKELPDMIPHMYTTKINRIEYNGGFITNQIIGTFQEPIEWEGCFFGKYDDGGKIKTAKERAEEVRKFMGRPIRVGFPPANDDLSRGIGQSDAKMQGDKGIYIIEEYEIKVRNYIDVDYRIKLVPHMRQEKIKPLDADVIVVKVEPEVIANAANNVKRAAAGSNKASIKGAAKPVTKLQGPSIPFNFKNHGEAAREAARGNPKPLADLNRKYDYNSYGPPEPKVLPKVKPAVPPKVSRPTKP